MRGVKFSGKSAKPRQVSNHPSSPRISRHYLTDIYALTSIHKRHQVHYIAKALIFTEIGSHGAGSTKEGQSQDFHAQQRHKKRPPRDCTQEEKFDRERKDYESTLVIVTSSLPQCHTHSACESAQFHFYHGHFWTRKILNIGQAGLFSNSQILHLEILIRSYRKDREISGGQSWSSGNARWRQERQEECHCSCKARHER